MNEKMRKMGFLRAIQTILLKMYIQDDVQILCYGCAWRFRR